MQAAAPAREESLTAHFAHDHARIGALLLRVAARVEASRHEDARRDCAALEASLGRHLRFEEEVLFPLFEARVGVGCGPTALLRGEHSQLRRALAMLLAALDARDTAASGDALRFLLDTFGPHHAKEEHILYPAIDHLLSPSERLAVLARLGQG